MMFLATITRPFNPLNVPSNFSHHIKFQVLQVNIMILVNIQQ